LQLQVLHLAGDTNAYRKLIFQKGFEEICSGLTASPQRLIPNQLSLHRAYLAQAMEAMKGVRILELQKLKSELADYRPPPSPTPPRVNYQAHHKLIDSILHRALDLQKGVYEEFINVPESQKTDALAQLKYEFYSLQTEILSWCYAHYKETTMMLNASTPYLQTDSPSRSPQSFSHELSAQNHYLAESLRQTMSVAYFLVDFHVSYSHYCLLPTERSASSVSSASPTVSVSDKMSLKFKAVLRELEQSVLPELQHRLPSSEHARGKYYEFKLYQFMIGILSAEGREDEDEAQQQRQSNVEELISLYRKATYLWRELHQLEYYGTTYITIDPYKEGSRVIKMLGGLLCYEAPGRGSYEEGIAFYREAQYLMELTLKGQ
jgi:hypothetical protein